MTAPMTVLQPNSFRTGPDERGHFGIYGGRFVAETLMPLILELEAAYAAAKADPAFQREMDGYLTHYIGRPSPLYFAERLTAHVRKISAATGAFALISVNSVVDWPSTQVACQWKGILTPETER